MDGIVRRRVLGRLAGGVYVLTARDGARVGAATVAWVMQISFRPLLIACALGPQSRTFDCLRRSRAGALHVVAAHQSALARRFALPATPAGGTLNGEPCADGATGAPVVAAFPAHFDCVLQGVLEADGDHALAILRPVAVRCRGEFRPLTLAALRAYLERVPLPGREPAASRPAALAAARAQAAAD